VTRWRVLFGAALLLALVVGHLLRDTPGYVLPNADGSYSGDITQYVDWTRLVTLGGIQSAYSGTWPATYAIYPPVALLPYEVVGSLYQRFEDPSFDAEQSQQSLFLHEGIKFVALAWDMLTAVAIFALVAHIHGEKLASLAASAYVLNPAMLYDVAHWGQPDGAHSLFSVLSIGLLELGQVIAPWAALAAAALAKPQAWFLIPLVVIATFRQHGARGVARGAIAGGVVAGLIALPFILTGHFFELLSLPLAVSTVMPVVSADAHNLWWLVLQLRGQDPLFLEDSWRAVGPLTYRMLSAGLVGASMLLTFWLYWTRRASLAEAAALGVLGWFTFTTQAHENHLFFALPLLSLAWPARPALLVPFGVLSVTVLLNMVLQDQLVLEALGLDPGDLLVEQLRLFNAALNLACFVGWSIWATLRTPTLATSASRTEPVAWATVNNL
jgi:Gpi18-like mannosyltransferase